MRSFISLVATSLLVATSSLAQGPPWGAGHPPGGNWGGPPHGEMQARPFGMQPQFGQGGSFPGGNPGVGGGAGGWPGAGSGMPGGNMPGSGIPGGGMPGGGMPGGGMPGGGMPGGGMPGGDAAGGGAPAGGDAAGGGMPAGGMPGQGGAGGSQLKQETDFPSEPTKATMYTYIPKTFKKGNPIVLALHHCGGTGPGFFAEEGDWVKAADQKGFLMIFPTSPPDSSKCWDVSSKASLKHEGGGDSQTVANMVKFAQKKYGCSTKKAFVTGHSSGAMLTQVMCTTYPELFSAGAAISGVPSGCFSTIKAQGPDWNSTCTGGTLNEAPEYWVQQAKGQYPGYLGDYPRMMLSHGTQDEVLNYKDHIESTKQWCGLHDIDYKTPTKKEKLPSDPNYEVSYYGNNTVVAITADGVTHNNPAKVDLTCQFFGI